MPIGLEEVFTLKPACLFMCQPCQMVSCHHIFQFAALLIAISANTTRDFDRCCKSAKDSSRVVRGACVPFPEPYRQRPASPRVRWPGWGKIDQSHRTYRCRVSKATSYRAALLRAFGPSCVIYWPGRLRQAFGGPLRPSGRPRLGAICPASARAHRSAYHANPFDSFDRADAHWPNGCLKPARALPEPGH